MRSVAKFKLLNEAPDPALYEAVCRCLQQWVDTKLAQDDDGSYRIRKDGRPAEAEITDDSVEDARLFRMRVTEQIEGGKLTSDVSVLSDARGVHFACELGVVATGVARPNISLRAPRFVQTIASLGSAWQIENGRDRIFSQPFRVDAANGNQLIDLLRAPERALPVIAISEFDGSEAFPGLAQNVARRVTGLAHVCILDEEASWQLTEDLGQEWSCFNGAIRLYWPSGVPIGSPFRHPLWLSEKLESRFEGSAEDWLCNKLTRTVIEASSYLSPDGAFAEFESRRSALRIREAEQRAQSNSDYEELAKIYSQENGILKSRLAALQAQFDNSQVELEGLRSAYFRGDGESIAMEEAATEAPPPTISEAVARARARFGNQIAFPDDLEAQIATLSASAGPPSKVFEHLSGLNDLASKLAEEDSLGISIPIWLRSKNIDCSGESETIKKSKVARGARTFSVAGEQTYCEFHTKPSDGTSPDRCVRIYFDKAESGMRVRIGYIGRHF